MPMAEYLKVGEPSRKPISEDILRIANNLAERSQGLSDRIIGKLHPIMTDALPITETNIKEPRVQWPPLFDQLRDYLITVDKALDKIEDALSRTEL